MKRKRLPKVTMEVLAACAGCCHPDGCVYCVLPSVGGVAAELCLWAAHYAVDSAVLSLSLDGCAVEDLP